MISDAFVLTGTPLAVTVSPKTADLRVAITQDAYVLTGTPLAVTVTPTTADLIVSAAPPSGDIVLTATPLAIIVSGSVAALEVDRGAPLLPPPGVLNFGRRAYIPGRL